MTKSEIIKKVLKEFRNESEAAGIPARDDAAYERVIVAECGTGHKYPDL
jgi:hypothetical protein